MTVELLNLYAFAYAILKAGLLTGLLPGALIAALWLRYAKTSDRGKLIPFPRKPQGPWPKRRADRTIRRVA